MKLKINQQDLLPVLTRVAAIADPRSTLPILGNVLLAATHGKLMLAASDLNQSVSADVAADIDEPGSVALPARDLVERVKMLPGTISISYEPGKPVTLKSGSRRFVLHSIPGEDFPALPTTEQKPVASLPAADLLRLINGTHFAISTDESRLHLNSMLFEVNGMMRAVATDGHRLSLVETATPAGAGVFTALIPLKAVLQIKRLCEDDAEVTLTPDGVHLFVSVGGFRYCVKTVDSQFPPFRQVIPEKTKSTAAIQRLGLLNAVKAIAVCAADRTSGIKLAFTAGKLSISGESPESGEGADELGCAYEGDAAEVGCNARYLADALAALDCDDVTIGLSAELDPVVISPAGETAWSSTAVVMPQRL